MTQRNERPASQKRTYAERVIDTRVGACRLVVLPTPVQSVISFEGSFLAEPAFEQGEETVQDVVVSMLDRGTRRHDRFELAAHLEGRGAQLQFHSEQRRIGFGGKMLAGDLSEVLSLVAEQLYEPLFDPNELEKVRLRTVGTLRRSMENSGLQAAGELSRALYAPAHPNYTAAVDERIAIVEECSVEDVRAYHATHFGTSDLVLVLVGDVDPSAAARVVERLFGARELTSAEPAFEPRVLPPAPGLRYVVMPDKQNIDVRMGHGLDLFRQDPDYIPLMIGNYILGGNFSARLMSTIRDQMGLTYGISSALSGVTSDVQGHWQTSVTLSRENLTRGVEATRAEVSRFVDRGVTADEVREKAATIAGSFKVGLATTGGLATVMLTHLERGQGPEYLDRFPEEVAQTSVEDVNAAIGSYLHPDELFVAMAGSVDEKV